MYNGVKAMIEKEKELMKAKGHGVEESKHEEAKEKKVVPEAKEGIKVGSEKHVEAKEAVKEHREELKPAEKEVHAAI
jgi:hypothetical protein